MLLEALYGNGLDANYIVEIQLRVDRNKKRFGCNPCSSGVELIATRVIHLMLACRLPALVTIDPDDR